RYFMDVDSTAWRGMGPTPRGEPTSPRPVPSLARPARHRTPRTERGADPGMTGLRFPASPGRLGGEVSATTTTDATAREARLQGFDTLPGGRRCPTLSDRHGLFVSFRTRWAVKKGPRPVSTSLSPDTRFCRLIPNPVLPPGQAGNRSAARDPLPLSSRVGALSGLGGGLGRALSEAMMRSDSLDDSAHGTVAAGFEREQTDISCETDCRGDSE